MGDRKGVKKRTGQRNRAGGDHVAGAGASAVKRAADACSGATRALDHGVRLVGDSVWIVLKGRPFLGVVLAAGAGLGVAVALGPGELAIGVASGYAAYQLLKKHLPPSEAVRKALELEKDIG